jgi:hypothetical protein
MKYLVKVGNYHMEFDYVSDSRNSKEHLKKHFGTSEAAWCDIYENKVKGKQVSAARSTCENGGKIFNVSF